MIKQLFGKGRNVQREAICSLKTIRDIKGIHTRPQCGSPGLTRENFNSHGNLWPWMKQIRLYAGDPGSGAGKGGGAGGSVRESGGGLGRFGAANEEGYFFNKAKEQLEEMKKKQKSEPEQKPDIKRKDDA